MKTDEPKTSLVRKLFPLIVMEILLLCCLPLLASAMESSGSCGQNVTYTLSDEGVLTISGSGAIENYDHTSMKKPTPWYSSNSKITQVVISNGVTGIGTEAFYGCTGLTSIAIPESITDISGYAFYGCTGLAEITVAENNRNYASRDGVLFDKDFTTPICCPEGKTGAYTIPDGVTSIGDRAFYGCTGLTSVTIPNSVTGIGNDAFSGCTGLTSVTIPNSVTSIGRWAFSGCTGLTSIAIPEGVTSIGSNAFYGCTGLTGITVAENNPSYASRDGALFNKDVTYLYLCPAKKTGAYTIPDGVTIIDSYAFKGCTGLTGITIPESTTNIARSSFDDCSSLKSFQVAENNPIFAGKDGVLFSKEFLPIEGSDNFELSDDYSVLFRYPRGKTGAYAIPGGVTSIGDFAFDGCTGLTSVTIPEGVTSIGHYAFDGCTGLTSVTIPNGVTTIGHYTFNGCTGLTNVTIPGSVTTVENDVFFGCSGLTGITVAENSQNYASRDGVLFNKDKTELLLCPAKKTGAYTIPNGVTSIGNNAFEDCTGLTSVTIPDSVTSIGRVAFYGCTGLTSVTIPNSVTSIGYGTFLVCTGLTSVTIPDSVTTIEGSAFTGCSGLTSITIPASVTSIGDRAFYACSNLKKAVFMGNAPSVGEYAFHSNADDFCIYYQPNTTGWTTPTWTSDNGDTYPCKPISEDPDQPNKTEDQVLIEQAQAYGLLDHLGTTVDLTAAMTRLDMAKLLADFAEVEVDEADAGSLTFTDCDDLTTEEKALLYALCQAGYIAGYADGSFGPSKAHVRCEAATFLDRMLNGQNAGKPQKGGYFTDVPDSAWYANFINSLYETGVLTTEKGTFSPTNNATMGDVLRWFVAAHEKKANGAVSTISLTGATTVKVGETITLTAATSPAGLKYGWSSSDKTVAAVSNGRVSGVKAGSAAITVRLANGNSATVNVSVTASSTTPITPVTPPTPSGGDDEPETPTEPTVETETSPDGTVTTTTTWTDGKKAVQEKAPDGSAKVEVTSSTGETIAKVELPADPGAGKDFEDVKPDAWYEGAVDKATAYGLFDGSTETTFAPNGSMTRGMVAQVLYNLSGKTGYGAGSGNFTDVAAGKWYENAIDWAAKAEIVSGTGNGSFSPEQSVTREQLVTMLYRYAQAIGASTKSTTGLGSFPDGNSVSDYAKTAMQWAVAEGFISGRNQNGGKYIAPNGTATRAEVAAILTRFVEFLK